MKEQILAEFRERFADKEVGYESDGMIQYFDAQKFYLELESFLTSALERVEEETMRLIKLGHKQEPTSLRAWGIDPDKKYLSEE